MKAAKIVITVILAVILTSLLTATCCIAAIRHQLSPDGIQSISDRLDLYGSLSESLKKDGKTLEEWLTEQSDDNLLTRIVYSEDGLKAVSALGTLHTAVKGKIEDYVSDFYEKNGKGKITKEELMNLAHDLSGDLESLLNYKPDPSDFQDLEEYLDSQDLSAFDLDNFRSSVPAIELSSRILSSPVWFYAIIAVNLILILAIILINRNRTCLIALGTSSLIAGCILLAARCLPMIVASVIPGLWLSLAMIVFDILYIFFSYMLWGGIIFAVTGIILIIIAAITRKKVKA